MLVQGCPQAINCPVDRLCSVHFKAKVVFVLDKKVYLRWIFSSGLSAQEVCSQVHYIVFLDGRNLKWFLLTGDIFSEVVFNTGWTVYKSRV